MYGKIEENYEIFVKTQDLSGLMAAYQEALVNQDQQVRVLEPGHEYTGVARGINAMGELLVEKKTEPSPRFMRERYLSVVFTDMYRRKDVRRSNRFMWCQCLRTEILF